MAELAHKYHRRAVIAFHRRGIENSFSVEFKPFPIDMPSQSRKHLDTPHVADFIEEAMIIEGATARD